MDDRLSNIAKMRTIHFLCMCVRTRKNTTHTDITCTSIDCGGCTHATEATRGLLVTSESNPTKEKRRKYLFYVKRAPSSNAKR